ncbi:NUDIX domain-containing protein [Aneurinibacillus thermoaerophilus]|uniref:NUDIX domain-containing protein n=2 Tax=Aneurinibacillus thermoaerophilus TaxID=143495 RepID=UPI002E1F9BAC|nr:NUDIX domain-containing protein [Aneurinibacillus thermoaerophilus]MED0764800.1 NUDIX domain-containing protein [Aneurinibacillus thermoaerophilus]
MKESGRKPESVVEMMMYYFYDRSGQFISLTFEQECFVPNAGHVLVLAFAGEDRQEIVLTRHKCRGWEVPGGKVEPGEKPEEAARRELLEETGVEAESLHWIGQYIIDSGPGAKKAVKNIYTGMVKEWGEIPEGFETLERSVFPLSLMPFQKDMSPFIQDNIFPLCRAYLEKQK